MSLINRVRNKSKELKEETNKITRKRLRAIVKDDRQVISKHYEGIDITENELLDHLRYRILRVSPILTPIITSRISRIDRDINIFSDGKVIYLGHNFFLNSEDYMMHHILRQLGTIVTGMYMSSYYKTNDQDYQDFIRLVYLIIVEQIINTLMIKSPRILGMQQSIKSLVKSEYFANEVYENTTLKSNVYIQSFSTKKLQDLIEDTCVEHFENFMELRGNPDKKITFIVNMDFMGDSSQITLNGEALNKMRDIKQNLERTGSMEEHVKSLNLLRKTLKEQKEKEELNGQESSLSNNKDHEELEQEKQEQKRQEQQERKKQEHEKQEQQEQKRQEQQEHERQEQQDREKQEQQDREKQEQEIQKLEEIEEQLRQEEWQEDDEESEIQSWGDESLEEGEEDQNIRSSINSLTPEEQVELMGQISASIPPAVYEEWVKRCIDQNSQSSRDNFNILRELLKEYGYTNEHIDMLDKHMPITNNNENISEAFKYKFDMNREDSEEDLTPDKLRETIEELIEENGLEELMDDSDITLDEVMEKIKEELENIPNESESLEKNYEEEDNEDEEDIPNESESLEKNYEEEEDEEYKPKTLDQDGEIKPVESEEGELDLDINLPEGRGTGTEADDSGIEEMLDKLKEEYGDQQVEEIEELTEDEESGDIPSPNTSSDGTPGLEKSDDTDTLGEALSTLEQIEEIDEEIEKLTKILEEALNDKDINDMMTNETIIADSSISEQTTSDVVDITNSLDSDGEGHQDILGAMVLTNRVVDSYIDIKYHWYRELENFIKARKPNMNSSFSRPNKKYVHSGILLPSKKSSKLTSDIEFIRVFCDTSGSMSDKDIDILIGVIKKGEKMFPNKTEAFEFNNRVRKLKFNKGKLQDTLVGTGGTNIDAIFPMMSKRDTGKSINIVITDGGFSWRSLDLFLKKRKREIVVIILTNSSYYTELKASKNRYKVIMLGEDGEKVDINKGKIKGF